MRAYGIDLAVADTNPLTGVPALAWHPVALRQQRAPAPTSSRVDLGPDEAVLHARDDLSVSVRREPLEMVLSSETEVSADRIVHPLASFVGAAVAHWTRRTALHAAAVELHGRAWVLLAAPGGGKSSLAALLDARGHRVLADDLSVIDDGVVLAGPRSCDLRRESAEQLGRGERVEATPADRERWREPLAPAPCEAQLGGFVALSWSTQLTCEKVALADRLRVLAANDALRQGPSHPHAFLDLLEAPMLRLARPQRWESTDAALTLLEQATRERSS